MKLKSLLSLLLFIALMCSNVLSQTTITDKLNSEKLKTLPLDQHLFVHVNRTLFNELDTLWFKGYAVQGPFQQASDVSHSMIIALFDKDSTIVQEQQFLMVNGTAEGQIVFTKTLVPGFYQLAAYTSNMLNFDVNHIFRTTIEIKNNKPVEYNYSFALDKPFYNPNDSIELQLYAYDKNKSPFKKRYFWYYIDDGSEQTEKSREKSRMKFKTNEQGKAAFKLPYHPLPGDTIAPYKICFSGFSDWQENTQDIYIPSYTNVLDIQLLPEGGYLVDGLLQTVAFRCTDNTGKPIDISGTVLNKNNEVVTTFKSSHQGMGKFLLVPDAAETYTLEIEKPESYHNTIDFPAIIERGFALSYMGNRNQMSAFRVAKNFDESTEVTAVWQMCGIVMSTQTFVLNTEHILKFNTQSCPSGIAKLTLFDEDQHPFAERLVYIESDHNNKVGMATDKKEYKNREKVIVDLNALTQDSLPIDADLSLMVTQIEKGISPICAIPDIRDYTLFKTELSGNVYDPNQYFDDAIDAKSLAFWRDLVMLTHGWRKFDWYYQLNKMLQPDYAFYNYDTYYGVVTKGKEAVPNAPIDVLCFGKGIESLSFKCNPQGRFSLNPEFEGKVSPVLIFYADRKNKLSRTTLTIEDREGQLRDSIITSFRQELDPYTYIQNYKVDERKIEKDSLLKIWDTEYIGEVTTTAKRILTPSEEDLEHIVGINKHSLTGGEFNNEDISITDMILKLHPLLSIENGELFYCNAHVRIISNMRSNSIAEAEYNYKDDDFGGEFNFGDDVNYLEDEVRYHFSQFDYLTSSMIDRVAYVEKVRPDDGYIAHRVYIWMDWSKNGNPAFEKLNRNSYVSKRYDKVQSFYIPKYETKQQKEQSTPDRRVAAYWNNSVRTDSLGKAYVSFYTSDLRGDYLINVQGISAKHGPIFKEAVITVK